MQKKGVSQMQKMHLILTPDVFALRLDAAIFAYDIAKIIRKASENRKFRASKKPTVGFFEEGLRQ
jgi:hypothetical protein